MPRPGRDELDRDALLVTNVLECRSDMPKGKDQYLAQ